MYFAPKQTRSPDSATRRISSGGYMPAASTMNGTECLRATSPITSIGTSAPSGARLEVDMHQTMAAVEGPMAASISSGVQRSGPPARTIFAPVWVTALVKCQGSGPWSKISFFMPSVSGILAILYHFRLKRSHSVREDFASCDLSISTR